jgi:hypothetical protein
MSRLEAEQARHDQRLRDLDRRVESLTPLLTSVVTLTVEFKNLREELSDLLKRVDKRDEDTRQRDQNAERERRVFRRWIIGLAVAFLCALITAAATLAKLHS